jgi:hypothetical protein
MSKWYYTPKYAAYAPIGAEIRELPKDEGIVGRVLVEDVAGFFCRLSGTYRINRESLVVRWMHVEEQPFPVLRAATPRDANKIVYRDDMKELGFLVGAIEGEVEPKYAYCEPNKGVQTVGRAYVKNDPPTEATKRWEYDKRQLVDAEFEIVPCTALPGEEFTQAKMSKMAEGWPEEDEETSLVHGNGKVDVKLAGRIIDFLNEVRELDPKLANSLFRFRPQCNESIATHPTIQVCGNKHRYRVGLLGLLNGLCGITINGQGLIAVEFDEDDPDTILRFLFNTNVDLSKISNAESPLGWFDQSKLGSCRHYATVAAVQDCRVGCELPVLTPAIETVVTGLGDDVAPGVENQAYKTKWVKAEKRHAGLLARFCNESDMAYTYGILRDVNDGKYRCSTATSNVWCDECEVQVFGTTSMKQVNPPDMKPQEVISPSDLPKTLFGIPIVECCPPDSSDGNMTLKPVKDSYHIAFTEIGGENLKPPLKVSRWRRATRGDVGRIARFADENSSWDYGVLASVAEGVPSPFMVRLPVRPEGQYWYERCEVEVFRMEVERNPATSPKDFGQKFQSLKRTGRIVSEPVVASDKSEAMKSACETIAATREVMPLTAQAIQVAYARMKDRPQSATVSVSKEFAELIDKLDDEKGDTIMPDIAPEELAKVIADTKYEAFPLVDKREAGGIVVPKELEAGMQDMLQRGYEESKAIEINMQAVLMCFDHRTGELNLVTPGGFKRIAAKTSWLVAKNIAKLAGAGIRGIGLDRTNGF